MGNEAKLLKLTKQDVMDYLLQKGASAVMDTATVADILNRSMQTVQRCTREGKLSCDKSVFNRFMFTIDDVADFVLRNPRLIRTNQRLELSDERIKTIRRIVFKQWKTLADDMGIDDLIAEIQCRILQTRSTPNSERFFGGVVQNILLNIYRERKKKIQTVPLDVVEYKAHTEDESSHVMDDERDIEDTRATFSSNGVIADMSDHERRVRGEAMMLMAEIPLEDVKAIVRHYMGETNV